MKTKEENKKEIDLLKKLIRRDNALFDFDVNIIRNNEIVKLKGKT